MYRDNMLTGEPTSSTIAEGSYTVYDYRGVIRPSTVAESSSSVLAVEVHFLNTVYSEIIQFNGFLASPIQLMPSLGPMLPQHTFQVLTLLEH